MSKRLVFMIATVVVSVGAPLLAGNAPSRQQLDFFEQRIRPVLATHCYACHSVNAAKLKGGLRLDQREGLLRGGDSGPAVVAGDVEKSRLVQAIRYSDADTAMPPKQKLPEAAIKDLEAWIKMGAPWPEEAAVVVVRTGPDYARLKREHWAYQPIRNPALPAVVAAEGCRTDLDRFVLQGLQANKLKQAAPADRVTLIRRVCFDLIGLPPTPAEIDAFVNDSSPDAYEKLVNRLLASPRFGERWGRHWLDVARYAQSLTLRGFVLKDAWKYRDYVIDSFNQDRPYDQFLREQVAGDLLPADTLDDKRRQLTATTFLALGNTNLEEQDKQLLRMDVVDEQLETIGKSMLAQTIGCARCHDHKFDPIPTKDYYALAGILRNTHTLDHSNVSKWLEVPMPETADREKVLRDQEQALAALQDKIKQAKAAIASVKQDKDTVRVAAGGKPRAIAVADLPGVVVDDEQARKVGEWKHSTSVPSYVGVGYVSDNNEHKGEKTLTFQPELPHAGKYEVRLAYTVGTNRAVSVPVTIFSADGEKVIEINEQEAPPLEGRWVSLGHYNFEKNGAGFVLVSNEGTKGYVVADAVQFIPADLVVAADSSVPGASASPTTTRPVDANATTDAIKQMEVQLKKMQETGPKREMVLSVTEEKTIEESPIHIRGNVHNLGVVTPRGFLSAVAVRNIPALPANESGRRELALWLSSKQNPLPARVMANRIWQHLIGQGIVRTVDNFGTTGEAPSNPDLLDHLASRLMEHGWSVKALVREIVLSKTYQLAFVVDDNGAAVDPENRMCWRGNRQRLDADAIRDSILSISGQLDLTVGGSNFKPTVLSDYNYKHSDTRRSVYVAVFRNSMPEILEAFDVADPSLVTGHRNSSTVAPQALFMMNHPFVAEQASLAGKRLLVEGPTDASARVDWVYRQALGRMPNERERGVALKYVNGFTGTGKDAERDAWAQIFCGLFASLDFRYVN